MLAISLQAEEEVIRRIDWVGERDHPQPQDPAPKPRERYQTVNEATQGPIYENEINDNSDVQLIQKQEPIEIFGKGTYEEFGQQKIIKPARITI